jgi:hypothetical protein
MSRRISIRIAGASLAFVVLAGWIALGPLSRTLAQMQPMDSTLDNAQRMITDGRQIFRFDTFGSEAFWGDKLKLHQAIAGTRLGGIGPGLSPLEALDLGLKVDADALPADVVSRLGTPEVSVTDPATTVALLRLNAVVGVTGFFQSDGTLRSIGIQCALCHANVDNSMFPGIGRRLDGWANHDLNIGAIIALAPDLSPFAELLGVSQGAARQVFQSWGPGKFDAQLILDGKATNPAFPFRSGATLIPPAFGLAGVNLHTWTGGWGTITYWNAFVANLEMQGQGTFFDPRLNDASQFPVAARAGLGDKRDSQDMITPKLAALHFYQLAIPVPKPPEGSFDPVAARRGEMLFGGKAKCASCHVPPLFTEPGWNLHTPQEICVDDFQANRSPDKRYRTTPLRGLFTHRQVRARTPGPFFHDGRFATLDDVVNHYNACRSLALTEQEKRDLVQYLLSL